MCAIVDANVASEIFGPDPKPAGAEFFDWLKKGSGRLVAGGKLLEELKASSGDFRIWANELVKAGKMRSVDGGKVAARTERIRDEGKCKSNDPHILALAQISGARLLYSNDVALQQDFNNKKLIDKPRGKVYSTLLDGNFRDSHKKLLRANNLCRRDQ